MSLYACQNVMSVLNGFSKLRRQLALGEKFLKIEELRLAVLEPRKIYNENELCTDTSTKRPRSSEGILSTITQC